MVTGSQGVVRIGNCSGFYGDRLSAMREMLTGGDLDYLTGDYLAELTMLILARDRAKNAERGYAKTFLTQLEECLGLAHDRGVRVVANGVDVEHWTPRGAPSTGSRCVLLPGRLMPAKGQRILVRAAPAVWMQAVIRSIESPARPSQVGAQTRQKTPRGVVLPGENCADPEGGSCDSAWGILESAGRQCAGRAATTAARWRTRSRAGW